MATFAAARGLVAAVTPTGTLPRLGLCTFSCKNHWEAIRKGHADIDFNDALGFYDYARKLGGDGVQTSARKLTVDEARHLREHVEGTGGYYEADVRLPKVGDQLDDFEKEIRLAKEAGATIARVVAMGGRRYEVFRNYAEFRQFQSEAVRRLQQAEPIARKHRIKLAMENHKDFTVSEQLELIRTIDSEWLGVLVDTGNNIAMCEDPDEVIQQLAPHALSCHLKDMAVQPMDDGFLLSEVPFGTGFLDLPKVVRTLGQANSDLIFHVEMATRDPLRVPCRADAYWQVFPERREAALQRTLAMVAANPASQEPPAVSGLSLSDRVAEEETNNQACLDYRPQLAA